MGRELYRLYCPALTVRQVFSLEAFKEAQHLRQALLVIAVLNGRADPRRIGGYVVLQRYGNVDQPSRHDASSGVFSSFRIVALSLLDVKKSGAGAAQRRPPFQRLMHG
jgi:hypothetical protein